MNKTVLGLLWGTVAAALLAGIATLALFVMSLTSSGGVPIALGLVQTLFSLCAGALALVTTLVHLTSTKK